MTIRIAAAAIGDRVYMGRVNKDGTEFVGDKKDVTSDVLRAVVDMIGAGGEAQVRVDGVTRYVIRVVEVEGRADGGYSEWVKPST